MVGSPAPGYLFKLARAVELYNFIYEQSAVHIENQLKYDATPQLIADEEWDILTWLDVGEPNPAFGVWVGELVHDVRSALDQIVYSLVIDNNRDPGEHTQFPIYDSKTNWINDIEERDATRVPSPIAGVTDDQFTLIKAAQPYHLAHKKRPGHPLMQLKRMSNVDKHRTLHVAAIRASTPTRVVYEPRGYMTILKKQFVRAGTLVQTGTEIGRVKRSLVTRPPLDMQVKIRIQGVTELVFMEEGKQPIAGVDDLGRIIQRARDIAHKLQPWAPVPLPEG